jgi:hypothetical protein
MVVAPAANRRIAALVLSPSRALPLRSRTPTPAPRPPDVVDALHALPGLGANDPGVRAGWRGVGSTDGVALSVLTPREREVLQLAADELSSTAIAEALVVSPGTVKSTFRTSTPSSARPTGLGCGDRTLARVARLTSASASSIARWGAMRVLAARVTSFRQRLRSSDAWRGLSFPPGGAPCLDPAGARASESPHPRRT